MKLFSGDRRRAPGNDLLARRIAGAILHKQYLMAAALNKRTEHYSRRRKILLLILLCLLLGSLNAYVLLSGLSGPGR